MLIIIIIILSLSLHCNSEITEKDSYDTREITFSLLSSYRLVGSSRFTHDNSQGFRIFSGFTPVIRIMTKWVTWGKEWLFLTQKYQDYQSLDYRGITVVCNSSG